MANETSMATPARLTAGYRPAAGRWDEMMAADGSVRPHWQPLLQHFAGLGAEERTRAQQSARRLIRENGVTFNVYDDAGGEARPWELDLLPLVIAPRDWEQLAAGLIQRTRLAEAILADFYGPQRLLAEGRLPPHLLFGDPHFLRPVQGLEPPGGMRIHFMAFDIARDAAGRWTVLSERADAASGAGYALENRIVVGQVLGSLFREAGVQRLAGFFQRQREALYSLAATPEPAAVVLTPGPMNEAYFEHSFIARYLGMTLVEGDDLVARDGAIYLRTLPGLERVHVIFRRVRSDWADPLEFRSESLLGVPGLAEAARHGGIVLANALGTGLIGSPGLTAFEPMLAKSLLGEELTLPSEDTYWLGTADSANAALAEIDQLVFLSAFDGRPLFSRGSTAQRGRELGRGERARLARQLELRGYAMTAQRVTPLGTAPVLQDGQLVPRAIVLRAFVAWTPAGYIVMPGALTRVAPGDDTHALNSDRGSTSKDTWVLAAGQVEQTTLLHPPGEPVEIRRTGAEAPSRAMDNLFWLGRNAERAESLARVLRAVATRLTDYGDSKPSASAARLLHQLLMPESVVAQQLDLDLLIIELDSMVFDRSRHEGLPQTLQHVRRTAWAVRDRLSLDTWRVVLAFATGEGLPHAQASPDTAETRAYLDGLIRHAAALAGLAAESMTRGNNWIFLELGRRSERALQLAQLLRHTLVNPDEEEHSLLQLLLEIADSTMTYRYRYLDHLQPAPVIDLLLLDESNPRAVAFQLARMEEAAAALPRFTETQQRLRDLRLVRRLLARLGSCEAEELAQTDEAGRRPRLEALLQELDDALPQFSTILDESYFRHFARRRAGSAPRRES
jgi:uncharacterized circularly permuted ATP-grasp superfamily protein/uncharacterized alpha-E superfamily protein